MFKNINVENVLVFGECLLVWVQARVILCRRRNLETVNRKISLYTINVSIFSHYFKRIKIKKNRDVFVRVRG